LIYQCVMLELGRWQCVGCLKFVYAEMCNSVIACASGCLKFAFTLIRRTIPNEIHSVGHLAGL
jgi:hypothetical protein